MRVAELLKVNGNWKKLWKIQVPNKIKIFLWRALRAVQEIWTEADIWHNVKDYITNATGFIPMVFQMIDEVNSTVMPKVAVMLWTLWWRRNQKCWQEKIPSVFEVTRRARDTLQDWLKAHQRKINTVQNNIELENHTWTKPPFGKLKIRKSVNYPDAQW
ncbi:putative ribonuclease H protein [Trifolium medium]|uniref:Putative ribonuclease H protein n=1 Tax=Trifolium medium TaxID=97028 RepID=A0A392NXL3_9FABA|nr:putative ribonuclease H protein [Trifolium medium]